MYTNGLKDRFGSPLLSKRDADTLYFDKQNGIKSYDWTPNTDLKIQFSLTNNYTIPVNGWLVINSNTTDDNKMWSLSVNNTQLFNSDQRGNLPIQILLSKNDVISTDSTVNRSCYFLPCKSEVLDYRVTKTPYDIWANAVVEDENGKLSVQNLYVPDASSWNAKTPFEVKRSITRVEDEVAYDVNNNLVCNIQSSKIVNGSYMFYYNNYLESFSGDLSSLVNGTKMFYSTSLESFSGDLSSLVNGAQMFYDTSLESFSGDLSSLVNGSWMFNNSTKLTSFSGDLSNLVNGSDMFSYTKLTSFSGDLSSLTNGGGMFSYTYSFTSFSGDLSNLLNGSDMFYRTSLNEKSIQNIANTIRDISKLDKNDESIWKYPQSIKFNEDGSYTLSYTNITKSQRGRLDLSYDKSITNLTNINNSIAQIKAKGWNVYLNGTQQ